MRRVIQYAGLLVLLVLFAGCGEEYFATPEKTLQLYVENRMMGTRQELEASLNSFTADNRKWFEAHYMDICVSAYERDCPGEGIATMTTVWTDFFEPAGPGKAEIESSEIDEENGTAVLVVEGQEIYFVKQRGNWKIDGFFGVPEQLAERYPKVKAAL